MMKKTSQWIAMLMLLVFGAMPLTAVAADIPHIDKDTARGMLGKPDVIFIDVRSGSDWSASDVKIQGAVRYDPRDPEKWAAKLDKNKSYILYCA
jgi:rhodanese-related sulfurtransferase